MYLRLAATLVALTLPSISCSLVFDVDAGAEGDSDGGQAADAALDGIDAGPIGPRPLAEYHFDDIVLESGFYKIRDSSDSDPALDMSFEVGDQDKVSLSCNDQGNELSLVFPTDQEVELGVPAIPTTLIEECIDSNALTIEAWVTPGSGTLSGPARIVTLAPHTQDEAFLLGQEGADAVVRLASAGNRIESQGQAMLSTGELHYLAFLVEGNNLNLFHNAELIVRQSFTGELSGWAEIDNLHLTVGNIFGGGRPWAGRLHYVAVYCEGLENEVVVAHAQAGPPKDPEESLQAHCGSP